MTWTAPPAVRPAVPHTGTERELLDAWLGWHRGTLLRKCAGLTGAQLRRRTAPPSALSLLGLVRHMTNVERGWFWDFAGEFEPAYWTGADPSDWTDFSGVAEADPAADLEAFEATCARSRELVAGAALTTTFTDERGNTFSLRWVYLHMIEEYARHNGHADLLRERTDGVTGA